MSYKTFAQDNHENVVYVVNAAANVLVVVAVVAITKYVFFLRGL